MPDVNQQPDDEPIDEIVDDDFVDEANEIEDGKREEDESELIEFSLDDLGRAYAQAVGLEPRTADESNLAEFEAVDDPQDVTDADNAPCEISPKTILESILFMGSPTDVKLTSRKIASLMRDVTEKEINSLVKELNKEYEKQNCPYRIEKDGKNLQLVLIEEMEPIRQKFYGEVREAKLNQSSIDVLSIVAYNQPISRDDVDRLRSRPCSSVLKQLVKRKLLEVVENPSQKRAKLYQTTDRFLDLFHLESLADLPRAEPDYELL